MFEDGFSSELNITLTRSGLLLLLKKAGYSLPKDLNSEDSVRVEIHVDKQTIVLGPTPKSNIEIIINQSIENSDLTKRQSGGLL